MEKNVRFGSVCSGIEAASVAWNVLGWEAAFFSEIEPFPCAVLAHHYPDVPNLGDMTKFKDWPDAAIDLLCGGTPCQSFSVAGLRKGLADPRGNLMLTFGAIAARYRPQWLVWENVPGVLSSNGGADFGAFLGMLGELGYGFAYRVLDAQYFGVAQRRRRVFVVGCLGDWRSAAAVLFERHSMSGHPAPRREKGQRVANALTDRADRGGTNSEGQRLIPELAACVTTGTGQRYDTDTDTDTILPVAHSLRGEGFDASEDGTGRGTPLVPVAHIDVMPAMLNGANTTAGHSARSGHSKDAYIVPAAKAVRRLTPRECERLQGFPDDYSLIQHRNKPAADSPRYKALGNSWAVPNVRWIGQRIEAVRAIQSLRQAA
ncbi:DNA cytosine methyltransferase [Hydrogenophaga laconesensis]|uniref:Cytosine-specific methyltransferase n=1 Tax=Hydrogenophaga laconesensis TaxID=1805971 RepID=A0ABU1V489_9BURK|nr:DNA cytosine methyltransferase [Hydrogenophaga laconesensis]MDR7092282.1 DNA (cytosine-5)-methyltransferase 1 [Hydrogenophaga laconesensis]